MSQSNRLNEELNKLVNSVNNFTTNSLYSVLKHSLFCKYKFDSCGKYQCYMDNKHNNLPFDSKRACALQPSPCGFPTDTWLCPLLTTHTHVKSNGDTHTYLECVESSWSEDALLDPPNPDEQFWREISRNEPAQ